MEPNSDLNPSFEQVIAEYETLIHHIVSRHVPDPERALDITQETFLTAYRTYPDLQGAQHVRTWLLVIALNHCKDYIRRQWKNDEGAL